MYPTNATYKEKVKELDRVWETKVDIEHSKGTLNLTDEDIVLSGMSVVEKTQPGEDFTIGGTVASDLSLKIVNKPEYQNVNFTGATIRPYVWLTEDNWGRNFLPDSGKERISEQNLIIDVHNILDLLKGKEITISFYLKSSVREKIRVNAIGRYSIGEHFITATENYQRFNFTTTIEDRNNSKTFTNLCFESFEPAIYGKAKYGISVYGKSSHSIISVQKIQIELGEYMSDWRPAVEDWSEPIPLGIFNVDEQSRFRSTIELKAMDNMIKLDRPYSYSKLSYPATLYQIYVDICNVCNVLPATHDFLHKDLLVQNRPEGDYSCRDILGFVAQLSGSFAKITRDGKVALKWYEPTELELGPMNRFEFKPSDEQISITGVMAKESIENEGEDTKEKTYITGTDEYAIDLTENPLLQGDYETVLPAIFNKVKDIKFNPYTAKWQGDPAIEAGDMVKHIDVDGNIFNTIITGSTYKYRGASNMEAKAKSEASKGYKGSTSKKLANVVQKIVDNRTEIEDKLTAVEQAQLNATEMMANMLGGHLIEDRENGILYVADNTDLSQAQKVWKWGIGGFGYSENGVDGPYTTAITADGSIVAMLVAAHIITADMVRTGILQSEDGSTWINLDNGHFNLKNVIYDDNGFRIIVGGENLEEELNKTNDRVISMEQTTEGFRHSIGKYEDGKLEGTHYLFTGENAIFKGAGLVIEDADGNPNFYGDPEGNLMVSASFTTGKDKNRYVGIADNGIWLNSELSGEQYRIIGEIQGQPLPYTELEGVYLNHGAKKFMAIGGYRDDSKQTLQECIFIDVGNILGYGTNYPIIALEGTRFEGPVTHNGNTYHYGDARFEGPVVRNGKANYYGHTRFHGKVNFDADIRSKYLLSFGPYGESTAGIGTSHGDRVLIFQADYNGLRFNNRLGNTILMYDRQEGEWWFHRSINTTRDLFVNGSKNVIHKTDNYGERLINAYETAEYYFGDIGSGKINKDGECVIYIDDIFQECINTEVEYHVFLQKNGKGDVWVKEKHADYFVIEGTPDLEFSWELKAKRIGYEHHRLEQPDKYDLGKDDSSNFRKEALESYRKDEELEDIYNDELSFDLVSLLLNSEEVY